jgi:hypothetical protein
MAVSRKSTSDATATTGWLVMASVSALIASSSAWPWSMRSAGIASAILAVTLWINFMRPWRRRRKLRFPVNAFFIIPAVGRECAYAEQDSEEHYIREIVLPANCEMTVHLVYKPRFAFHTTDVYFGCEDVKSGAKKPRPIEYDNPFIERGRQHVIPGRENNHFLDIHGYYHIVEEKTWSDDRAFAFKMEIGASGVYKAIAYFAAEEAKGSAELSIRVEGVPKTSMHCINPAHKRKACSRGMSPRKIN